MSNTRRLFFALWPDDAVRARIRSAPYPHLKPRTTPPENWHMTLVFLGQTTSRQQLDFEHAADLIRVRPFTVSLDITGQFSRARVAWLGCSHPDPELLRLQGELAQALWQACPEHQAREAQPRPFAPHVTLYRHIRQPAVPTRIAPVEWPVDAFYLIESRPSEKPVYRLLRRWELNPPS